MSDSNHRAEGNELGGQSKEKRTSRYVAYVKGQLHEYRAYYKNESATDRAARRTANASWVMAVFTIVITVVGYLQWRTLEKSDQTLRKTVEATQRPWLKIVNAAAEGGWPFKKGGRNITKAMFEIKNVGNGVATEVSAIGLPIQVDNASPLETIKQAKNLQKHICDLNIAGDEDGPFLSDTVFISAEIRVKAILQIPETLIENESSKFTYIGCLSYRSVFSEKPYETGFRYDLTLKVTKDQRLAFASGQEIAIPSEAISLSEDTSFIRAE